MGLRAGLCTILMLSLMQGTARAASDEDRLKAEFLVRFAGFTTWPANAFEDRSSPVVIGVWGDSNYTRTLSNVIGSRTAGDRKIVARTVRSVSEARSLHMLFIPRASASSIDKLLAELAGLPVMTVSEVSGFCKRGGVLNFYRDGNYIRFEANPDAARAAGLQVSSQLLRLARIVRG
jgi:hypothetical protein